MKRTLLAVVLVTGGCASDKVTLLENEDGNETGAVAVLSSDGKESVIDRPLTEVRLSDGPTRGRAVKRLKPAYNALLNDLPPKAKGFVITFPLGQSRIPIEQRAILEGIRTELSIRPGAQIEVAGFTDSSGEDTLNDTISRERAEGVAQELREYGFPIDPSDVVGRGEDEAKASLGDGQVDESFRRVVVFVR